MYNGRAPATGAYVPSHIYEGTSRKEFDSNRPAKSPAPTIVACANEFGCLNVATHTSDNLTLAGRLERIDKDDDDNGADAGDAATFTNTSKSWSYNVPYVGESFRKSLGVTMEQSAPAATEDAPANPVHPRALRKAVCKCNMGFTSPLQLESSWCGAECPGPDCALTSAAQERTEATKIDDKSLNMRPRSPRVASGVLWAARWSRKCGRVDTYSLGLFWASF